MGGDRRVASRASVEGAARVLPTGPGRGNDSPGRARGRCEKMWAFDRVAHGRHGKSLSMQTHHSSSTAGSVSGTPAAAIVFPRTDAVP